MMSGVCRPGLELLCRHLVLEFRRIPEHLAEAAREWPTNALIALTQRPVPDFA